MVEIEPISAAHFHSALDAISAACDGHSIVSVAATVTTMLSLLAIGAEMPAEKDADFVELVRKMLASSLQSVRADLPRATH